jgi:hypothetical protein
MVFGCFHFDKVWARSSENPNPNPNPQERVTARLGTLDARIAEEHCHSQQHESEMKEKLKLEAHTRQQTLVQLSAGVQAEIEAAMEDTAKKLEVRYDNK